MGDNLELVHLMDKGHCTGATVILYKENGELYLDLRILKLLQILISQVWVQFTERLTLFFQMGQDIQE